MSRRRDIVSVDWSTLHHTFGPATEVPDLLRRVWSDDEGVRRTAYGELVELLVDQGSRYPASAAAVPFLIDVVADPAAPDRFGACQVLSVIAIGDEEYWWAERPDMAQQRREVQRKAGMSREALQREAAAWAASAPTEAQRQARASRNDLADVDEDRDVQRWAMEAYDAVRVGGPVYLAALRDEHPWVRLWATHLLGYFPEDRDVIASALARLLADEPKTQIAATACVTAGLLTGASPASGMLEAVSAQRDSDDVVVRRSAAIGLAQLVPHRPDRLVIEDLYAALLEAGDAVPNWPHLGGDMSTAAALTIAHLPAQTAPDRVDVLVSRLMPDPAMPDPFMLTDALLRAAFPDGPVRNGASFADLSAEQRTAVLALRSTGLADTAMIAMLLNKYNVPEQ